MMDGKLEWMPIHSSPLMLPAKLLSEEWAQRNHMQSLRLLASRGGLSLSEAAAVASGRPWHKQSAEQAIAELQTASLALR